MTHPIDPTEFDQTKPTSPGILSEANILDAATHPRSEQATEPAGFAAAEILDQERKLANLPERQEAITTPEGHETARIEPSFGSGARVLKKHGAKSDPPKEIPKEKPPEAWGANIIRKR
jgi:hypothetical protein